MWGTDNLSKPKVGMNTSRRLLVKKGHSKKNSIFWLWKTLMHFHHLNTDIRFKSPKFSALYSTQEKHSVLDRWLKNIFWSLAVVGSIHRSGNAENSHILSHWKKKTSGTKINKIGINWEKYHLNLEDWMRTIYFRELNKKFS